MADAAGLVLPASAGAGAGLILAMLAAVFAGTRSPRLRWMFAAGAAAVAVWAWLVMPHGWLLPVTIVLGWMLLLLAAVDCLALRLPDVLTLPLALAGLAVAFRLPDERVLPHLAGMAAGYGLLFGIALVYRGLRGREGIGMGDAKLLAGAGAWLGWSMLPSVLLIACAFGFAWLGVSILARGHAARQAPIPFGAPLGLAIWLVWLYGPLAL